MDGREENRKPGIRRNKLNLKELLTRQIKATEENTEMLSRVLSALENLDNTQSRMIERDFALTGILSRTQEIKEQRKIKREVVGGSGGKSLEFAKKSIQRQKGSGGK